MPPRGLSPLALPLLAALSGCLDRGACLVESPTGIAGWEACYDGYLEEECDAAGGGGALYRGRTCEELGYTKGCPGEGEAKRHSVYGC